MAPHYFTLSPEVGYTIGNMLVAEIEGRGGCAACAVPHYRCRTASMMVEAATEAEARRELQRACDTVLAMLAPLLDSE